MHENFKNKHKIAQMPLCDVLLDENANFPWFILIPRIPNAIEILDLTPAQRKQMWFEIEEMAQSIQDTFNPDKLNIANIGNITPQLHIHIVARFKKDKAWPQPVWGFAEKQPYTSEQIEKIKNDIYLPLFLN